MIISDDLFNELLRKWDRLDLAARRMECSTPRDMTTSIQALEAARTEMRDLIHQVAIQQHSSGHHAAAAAAPTEDEQAAPRIGR